MSFPFDLAQLTDEINVKTHKTLYPVSGDIDLRLGGSIFLILLFQLKQL